jgi:hypothetical protein
MIIIGLLHAVHSFLTFYGNIFYTFDDLKQSYKKDVPSLELLKEHLTPSALAYWYMDDGALRGDSGCQFCTDNFSAEGIDRLKLVFKEKYNIVINLHKAQKKAYFQVTEYILMLKTAKFLYL